MEQFVGRPLTALPGPRVPAPRDSRSSPTCTGPRRPRRRSLPRGARASCCARRRRRRVPGDRRDDGAEQSLAELGVAQRRRALGDRRAGPVHRHRRARGRRLRRPAGLLGRGGRWHAHPALRRHDLPRLLVADPHAPRAVRRGLPARQRRRSSTSPTARPARRSPRTWLRRRRPRPPRSSTRRVAVPIHYDTIHHPPIYAQVDDPAGRFVAEAERWARAAHRGARRQIAARG